VEAHTERNGSLKITPTTLAAEPAGARFEFWIANVTARIWQGGHLAGWLPQARSDDVILRWSTNAAFAAAVEQARVLVPVRAGALLGCQASFSSLQAGAATNISLNFSASLRNAIEEGMLLRLCLYSTLLYSTLLYSTLLYSTHAAEVVP